MIPLQDLFIALVRAGLFKETLSDDIKAELSDEKLNTLYSLAQSQSLAHLCSEGLFRNGLLDRNTAVGKAFYKAQMMSVMRQESMQHALDAVSLAFCESEVPFIPLKGSVLKNYYPEVWMRTSCDIDILIHPEDEEKCSKILCEKLGYTYKFRDSYDMSFFSPDGVHLELHVGLMERRFAASNYLDKVWEVSRPVKDGSYCYLMSNDMFYFHQVSHLYKHFVSGGCGVRLFLDLFLLKNHPDFNLGGEYKKYLKDVGQIDFEKEILKLAGAWFGNEEHTDLTRKVERYVLSSGTFGTVKNEVALNREEAGSKAGYVFGRIFLSTELLCDYYPELRRKKWQAPLYQVKRWIGVLKGGNVSRAYNEIMLNGNVSEEYSKELKEMMSKLKI